MRVAVFLTLLATPAFASAAEPQPAGVEFFESKVRPLLIDNCFSCHGEKKQEAGLRLDSRAAILKGSDTGPVVTPGEPDKSKLIKAIRHEGDLKMPFKEKKLSADSIETLVTWVKLGVPFPDSGGKIAPPSNARQHWAYQPVQPVQPPKIAAESPIDRFVLAKLEAQGLRFSPTADRRTLIRRVTFDLIGLPPTSEEIDAFIKHSDAKPQAAYAALVDRLLASPRYGEAQARHWLDLARYSDTKGYVFQEDRNYPNAYTYRDWVIRALNEDMPYDRFVQLQIAADRMNVTDKRDLAAMGFLTVGRRFLNNINDIIDDRLDVTCRTFLGMTVTCARCHDHKYDPIPAKDYYSLYGVFASSTEPKDLPTIGEIERSPEVIAFEKELAKREEVAQALTRKLLAARVEKLRTAESIAAYLQAVRLLGGKPNEQVQAYVREKDLSAFVMMRWRDYLLKGNSPVFAPLMALSALKDDEFAAKAPEVLAKAIEKKPLNPLVVKTFDGKKPATFKDVAEIYGKLIASHSLPVPGKVADNEMQIMAILGADGPIDVPFADAEKVFNREDKNKVTAERKKIDAFKAASPFAPPRAMVLNDGPIVNPYVFLRGNQGNRGPTVPRQFLEVLSGPQRKPFSDGSGRLELAKAIADPKNPLTARVMVNRIWMGHFGQGLVRTPSNFGLRADPPTHPELLDWLAGQFVESGWSVKKIHRLILLSKTYQQASDVTPEMAKVDPENRMLSRMSRRRLEFEALRDGMLAVSGQLDPTAGGKSVDLFKEPFTHRRTVYGFIDRQNLPGTLRIFDFASPDQHTPQRFVTTVPQQALFLMNSPFVMDQARKLAARSEVASKISPEERIAAMYRAIYGRVATPSDTALALKYVELAEETGSATKLNRWEQLAQVLLLGNEFAFVD